MLNEIVRSFSEITEKKILFSDKENKSNPLIEKTLEINYGLRNFIGNAIKYSNNFVQIDLESNKKFTKVTICDDGPGFSDDIKNLLGEPYIRSKNKIISSKSGLGLGTFIGKTLLEKNYANIIFKNTDDNSGAEVIIKWENKNLMKI